MRLTRPAIYILCGLLALSALVLYKLYPPSSFDDIQLWKEFRVPAVLTALVSGGALGVSGLILQSFFRNPLAGPFVLGSSAGASLGVAIGLFLMPVGWVQGDVRVPLSFVGSMLSTVGIVLLARRASGLQVLVAGMLFAQVCAALVSLLIRWGGERELRLLSIWQQGSFHGTDLSQSVHLLLWACAVLLLICFRIRQLDALLLGDEAARLSGLSSGSQRLLLLSLSSLLTGVVVAWCGPVGFVGLVTPLLVQSLLRSGQHKWLIPGNLVLGSLTGLLVLTLQEIGGTSLLPLDAVASIVSVPILLVYFSRTRHA